MSTSIEALTPAGRIRSLLTELKAECEDMEETSRETSAVALSLLAEIVDVCNENRTTFLNPQKVALLFNRSSISLSAAREVLSWLSFTL